MPSAPKWLFDIAERLQSKLPTVTVSHTEMLSGAVKKVRFRGDFSLFNFQPGFYIDFRVSDTDVRRYTPSYTDVPRGIMEVVFYLHGSAPGSLFMDNLKPGDTINLTQPRGHKYYDSSSPKYVIFGDETSLGLACSFFDVMNKNGQHYHFLLELDEDNKQLPDILGLDNYTLFPKNSVFRNEELISKLPLLQTPTWNDATFILTGNAKSVQTFRKVLKDVVSGKILTHGYWLEGKKGL